MSMNSTIEWTDHTFNPWWGCVKVSAGCDNCYAEVFAKRYDHDVWGPDAPRRFLSDNHWDQPIIWNRTAALVEERAKVFCASMADVFERRDDLVSHRRRLVDLIRGTTNLDWQVLTKRPQNIKKLWPMDVPFPSNMWLGTTVENQDAADKRIKYLLECDTAALLFLSCEPLLGPVDIRKYLHSGPNGAKIDWVIIGGESGRGARPMNPLWAQSLIEQCQEAGTPVFFKQWGEFLPPNRLEDGKWQGKEIAETKIVRVTRPNGTEIPMYRVGKKAAGRQFLGREWNAIPMNGLHRRCVTMPSGK